MNNQKGLAEGTAKKVPAAFLKERKKDYGAYKDLFKIVKQQKEVYKK